jgi:indoleamine 2,3-dioxygenase
MRNYMPGPHRRFLERIGELTNIRDYATSLSASNDVRQAYSAVVMKLGAFRDKHIQIVSRYIITPATQHSQANLPDSGPRRMNLATATTILTSASSSSSSKSAEIHNRDRRRSEKELYGTGGTDLIPFLKTTRDETKAAALCVD